MKLFYKGETEGNSQRKHVQYVHFKLNYYIHLRRMGEVKYIERMIVPSHLSQLFQTMENMGREIFGPVPGRSGIQNSCRSWETAVKSKRSQTASAEVRQPGPKLIQKIFLVTRQGAAKFNLPRKDDELTETWKRLVWKECNWIEKNIYKHFFIWIISNIVTLVLKL